MFKSREERESRREEKAAQQAGKAVAVLRRRRSWLISRIAIDGAGALTGGTFDKKVDEHAKQLFYVDQALQSLTADPGEASEETSQPN